MSVPDVRDHLFRPLWRLGQLVKKLLWVFLVQKWSFNRALKSCAKLWYEMGYCTCVNLDLIVGWGSCVVANFRRQEYIGGEYSFNIKRSSFVYLQPSFFILTYIMENFNPLLPKEGQGRFMACNCSCLSSLIIVGAPGWPSLTAGPSTWLIRKPQFFQYLTVDRFVNGSPASSIPYTEDFTQVAADLIPTFSGPRTQ